MTAEAGLRSRVRDGGLHQPAQRALDHPTAGQYMEPFCGRTFDELDLDSPLDGGKVIQNLLSSSGILNRRRGV